MLESGATNNLLQESNGLRRVYERKGTANVSDGNPASVLIL